MVSRRAFHTSSSSQIRGRDVKAPALQCKQVLFSKDRSVSLNPREKDLEQLAYKNKELAFHKPEVNSLSHLEIEREKAQDLNKLSLSLLEKNI